MSDASWSVVTVGTASLPGPLPIGLPVPPEWEIVDVMSPEAVLGATLRDESMRCVASLCFEIRRARTPVSRVIAAVRASVSELPGCAELLPDGIDEARPDVCWCSALGSRGGRPFSTSTAAFEIPVVAGTYPRVLVVTTGVEEAETGGTEARPSDVMMIEVLGRIEIEGTRNADGEPGLR